MPILVPYVEWSQNGSSNKPLKEAFVTAMKVEELKDYPKEKNLVISGKKKK